ncbi:MAG: AAA family ATPase [Clostridiales bacterium]|jgi:hypothetical protein|nr:AAA family ATPase [Clostridiales bacterium]
MLNIPTYYLNTNQNKFARAKKSIYVDKSGLLALLNSRINSQECYVCVSRPRRFGKTTAADMLVSYYKIGAQSEDLFADLSIASHPSFKSHLNKYNVVFINMLDELLEADCKVSKMKKNIETILVNDLIKLNPWLAKSKGPSLYKTLQTVCEHTNAKFVFIIDEWDSILRDPRLTTKDHTIYIEFLKLLFKDKDYVALAYMTGILPIKKHRSDSLLNMFDEFTMINPRELTEFVGFTAPEVKNLCEVSKMDFEQMKEWYQGYYLNQTHVFCPYSVMNAVIHHEFDDYWAQTASYEALVDYIAMNFDGLKYTIQNLYDGKKVNINTHNFQNDIVTFNSANDVLTLLIHLGYLGYIKETNEVFIPNKEVRIQYDRAFDTPVWSEYIKSYEESKELLKRTARQ